MHIKLSLILLLYVKAYSKLFLYFSEAANHSWFKYLDIDKINLGSGKRSIVKDGIYNEKYRITVPQKIN